MAITKGRFQTHENKTQHPPLRWSVVDTEGTTLGERHMCACDDEIKATVIAGALNFNLNPGKYGYKLVQ